MTPQEIEKVIRTLNIIERLQKQTLRALAAISRDLREMTTKQSKG